MSQDEPSVNVIDVDVSNLKPVYRKRNLAHYFNELWAARYFIWAQARSHSFSTGRGSFLGKAWIILDPLLQSATYVIIFGLILKTTNGIDNFIGFLVIGVTFFGFISQGLAGGVGLIQKYRSLITGFNFPRAAAPIANVLQNFLDSIAPALVGIGLALVLQIGEPISWRLLLVIPYFVLIHLFALGMQFIIAPLTFKIPDLRAVINLIVRALFFLSGVFFSMDRFTGNPALAKLVELNPAYQFLMTIRHIVLDNGIPDAKTTLYLCAWTLILLIVGFFYYRHGEAQYAYTK